MKFVISCLVFLLFVSTYAFGQEPAVMTVDPTVSDLAGRFIPFMLATMVALRGIAELLLLISAKTANKTDDQVAAMVSKVAGFLGMVCGWFGVGMPRSAVMAVAEAQAVKELNVGGSNEQPK